MEDEGSGVLVAQYDRWGVAPAYFASLYDIPSYARRALRMQDAIAAIDRHCQTQRDEWLGGVRSQLRLFNSAVDRFGWPMGLGSPIREEVLSLSEQLVSDRPKLPAGVKPPSVEKTAQSLRLAIDRFNRRWKQHLQSLDLAATNELIEGYNRFYLLEKECSHGSYRVAARGFVPQEPITAERLLERFPLIPEIETITE